MQFVDEKNVEQREDGISRDFTRKVRFVLNKKCPMLDDETWRLRTSVTRSVSAVHQNYFQLLALVLSTTLAHEIAGNNSARKMSTLKLKDVLTSFLKRRFAVMATLPGHVLEAHALTAAFSDVTG